MKKSHKIIILSALVLAAITILCSCSAPNTVSSGTTYQLAQVFTPYKYDQAVLTEHDDEKDVDVYSISDGNISGCLWKALNEYRTKTYDASMPDMLAAIKYYTTANAEGNDEKSYSAAFTDAALKQFDLAVSGGAKIIVAAGEEYTNAYLYVKDSSSFGEITFVIITAPGSRISEAAVLNNKTTVVIIDGKQWGYLFGYYAAQNSFKKIGYVGVDDAASESLVSGLKSGAKDGGEAEVVSVLHSSGPVEDLIKKSIDDEELKDADILIGDELTMPYIAASGRKYASIYKDDNAEFCITLNSEALTSKLSSIIDKARQSKDDKVKYLTQADGIFTYSGSESLVTVPFVSDPNATVDTTPVTDTEAVSDTDETTDAGTDAGTAAETETDAETTAEA